MDGVGVARAREALDVVHAMASLMDTGLDRQSLAILIALCEHGVNPEALAAVVKELRREASALHVEEALEAIAGWDDAHQAAAIDDTPSQPENAENSQISPEVAVETTSRDISSSRNARDAALKEDSYNENFESDRSQSPSRTLSWNLAAAAAEHGGCSKDPKSPISVTAAAEEEMEKSPLKREVMSEVEVSNRPREPSEAAVTSSLRVKLQMLHQDDHRAELDVEERSGGREGFGVDKANCGTHVVKTTAEVEARPPASSIGVRVVGSSTVGDVPAFGSGSNSSSMSFRRNEQDSQPALPAENRIRFGFEGGAFVRSANDCIDQMTISVQTNLQVLDNMVVEEDHSENPTKSGYGSERMSLRVQHELNSLEKVHERGVRVETDTIPSTGLHDELETNAGLRCQDGPRVNVLSRKEKSNECSCSRTSSRPVIDASKVQSMQNAGVGVTPEECSQHSQPSPPSPPRPPRAVQEKLEKLRSQSGNKRAHSGGLDLIVDRLRTRDFSFSSALEAIRYRAGERPAGEVTAADLLKTALDVGITLPPPFHKNYFSR